MPSQASVECLFSFVLLRLPCCATPHLRAALKPRLLANLAPEVLAQRSSLFLQVGKCTPMAPRLAAVVVTAVLLGLAAASRCVHAGLEAPLQHRCKPRATCTSAAVRPKGGLTDAAHPATDKPGLPGGGQAHVRSHPHPSWGGLLQASGGCHQHQAAAAR